MLISVASGKYYPLFFYLTRHKAFFFFRYFIIMKGHPELDEQPLSTVFAHQYVKYWRVH